MFGVCKENMFVKKTGRTDSRSLAVWKKRVFSRTDEYVLDYPTRYFYLLKGIDEGERMKNSVGRSRYKKAVMALSIMLDKVFGGEADKSRIESSRVSISMKSIESVATFTERFENFVRSTSPRTFHRHRQKRPPTSFEPVVSRGTAGALTSRSQGPMRLSSQGTCHRQKKAPTELRTLGLSRYCRRSNHSVTGTVDIVVAGNLPSPKKAPTELRTHGLSRYCRRSNHSVMGAVDIFRCREPFTAIAKKGPYRASNPLSLEVLPAL
jgi:hypothetical protein